MIFSLFIGFALGVGAIIFILQNTATVALTFLGWQFESSLAIVVMLAILVGLVISLLISIPGSIGSSLQMGKLRKENRKLEEEVEKYKHTAVEATTRLNVAANTQESL